MLHTTRVLAAFLAFTWMAFLLSPAAAGAESVVWTHQFGTAVSDQAFGVAVDGAGNVYVAGFTEGALPGQSSSGTTDAFVRRYDASSTEIWTRQFGTAGWDKAWSVGADGAGSIYVAGETWGALPGQVHAGFADAFVRRYDATGAEIWTRQFGSASSESANGIATDGASVYAGGTAGALPGQPSFGGYDAFVRRYDVSGTELWTRQFGTASFDLAWGIGTDGAGNAYVAGQTGGALPGQVYSGNGDAFVRRYAANGAEIWTRQFGTPASDLALAVAADGLGNLFVAGDTFGALPGQVPSGGDDAFVSRYDTGGALVWTRQFGTAASDAVLGVATDGALNAYVAGYAGGALSGQVSSGGDDAFVARIQARDCRGSPFVILPADPIPPSVQEIGNRLPVWHLVSVNVRQALCELFGIGV